MVMEAGCRVVTENWRKKDEVKHNAALVNVFKGLHTSPNNEATFRSSFPHYPTYRAKLIPQRTPLTWSSKLSFTYLLTHPKTLSFTCVGGGGISELQYIKKHVVAVDI